MMATEQTYSSMRSAMVDSQLRTSDVNDAGVIAAMAAVPREAFLPEERQSMAYIDRPVRLGGGRALNPPLATGRLLTEAGVKAGDKVLLIGAATGYAAALLQKIGAVVTAVEEDPALAAKATSAGIAITIAPLSAGSPDGAPYDIIVVDGAVEELPAALVGQLAEGGRLVTGLVERGVTRLCAGRKSGSAFGLASLVDMEMVVLPGFAKPEGFVF
ncbi:protein-L-isoaspartate O-methyltransferase family protein [Sphingobium phenoxybenzoativorans]|uniref:protein-L-isoaspartate O-methyltransferase family protein n=1 Tax=Sphingobium phenoxybenzoativorans TaxID=1592790 RepID=UPI000872461B|nr:protein-L-isoaspartate O-methyltransferase [Sphingobium phenoxybenzoativorans]